MKHKQKIGITGAFGYLGSNFINTHFSFQKGFKAWFWKAQ